MPELLDLLLETTLLELEAAPSYQTARGELLALVADPAARDALDGATANLAGVVARLAFLRAQPATPAAQALAVPIATARAVLFATPSGARKSKAAGGLVDLLARAGQPSEVNS